jgi:DNA replication protein DnaC
VIYDDVDLTDEEIDKALQEAKRLKYFRLEDERKKLLAKLERESSSKQFTHIELWHIVRTKIETFLRGKYNDPGYIFQLTNEQKPVAKALSLYFTNSEGFEELDVSLYNRRRDVKFDLNKGIWLVGNPGVGKTMLMQAFSHNKRQCYRVLQCSKIVNSFLRDAKDGNGYESIDYCTKQWKEAAGASNYFQTSMGICYNDLGTENTKVNSYGNSENVMEYIFLQTSENNVPFFHRHVTTNLDFTQVEKTYGIRMLDRIREAFNVIELKGETMRDPRKLF